MRSRLRTYEGFDGHPDVGNRARAGRDEAARATRGRRDGMVPARVRAVGTRPGLRLPGGVVGPGGYGRFARSQRAPREPAHRGQSPVLLPDAERLRAGWAVGRVDAAVDGRGRPARHRDPGLPDGDAGDRPGRARAGADAAGLYRRDARVLGPARRARVHDAPGARRRASRTATRATRSTTRPARRS